MISREKSSSYTLKSIHFKLLVFTRVLSILVISSLANKGCDVIKNVVAVFVQSMGTLQVSVC